MMDTRFNNPDLAAEFMEFAVSTKHRYDDLVASGHDDRAEILESAWEDVCMARAMSLMKLQDARGYLIGGTNVNAVERCARYLNHLTEPRPMREYIAAFMAKNLDPWSIHVDAAYVYCKLRVSDIISNLLTSNDAPAVDHCRAIDNWVLNRIQPCYASKYIRLAENRTTFATAKQFCMYAIDTKRNSQEYLCDLIGHVDQLMATKLVPLMAMKLQTSSVLDVEDVSDTEAAPNGALMDTPSSSNSKDTTERSELPHPASSDSGDIPHPASSDYVLTTEEMEAVLADRYFKSDIIKIARALRLNPKRHKIEIVKEIVKCLSHRSCDTKYIKARVLAWHKAGPNARRW